MASLSSEERSQLHDSLIELLTDKYPFEHWKQLARAPGGEGFGRAEWKQFAEMGWLGVAVPDRLFWAGDDDDEVSRDAN